MTPVRTVQPVPHPARPRSVLLTVASLVAATVLAGCGLFSDDEPALPEPSLSPSPVESEEPSDEPAEPDLARFYEQELDWEDCVSNECAELEVPLDKKNLTVRRTESQMIITASYEQPIDLKLTKYVYRFNATEKAPLF